MNPIRKSAELVVRRSYRGDAGGENMNEMALPLSLTLSLEYVRYGTCSVMRKNMRGLGRP